MVINYINFVEIESPMFLATDTFRLVLTYKVQIIELKANAYFNSKTLKSIFDFFFIKYRT